MGPRQRTTRCREAQAPRSPHPAPRSAQARGALPAPRCAAGGATRGAPAPPATTRPTRRLGARLRNRHLQLRAPSREASGVACRRLQLHRRSGCTCHASGVVHVLPQQYPLICHPQLPTAVCTDQLKLTRHKRLGRQHLCRLEAPHHPRRRQQQASLRHAHQVCQLAEGAHCAARGRVETGEGLVRMSVGRTSNPTSPPGHRL